MLEVLSAAGVQIPVLQLGLPDEFIDHGEQSALLAGVGLDASGIEQSIRTVFQPAGLRPEGCAAGWNSLFRPRQPIKKGFPGLAGVWAIMAPFKRLLGRARQRRPASQTGKPK